MAMADKRIGGRHRSQLNVSRERVPADMEFDIRLRSPCVNTRYATAQAPAEIGGMTID
jgi:hypothetical protein